MDTHLSRDTATKNRENGEPDLAALNGLHLRSGGRRRTGKATYQEKEKVMHLVVHVGNGFRFRAMLVTLAGAAAVLAWGGRGQTVAAAVYAPVISSVTPSQIYFDEEQTFTIFGSGFGADDSQGTFHFQSGTFSGRGYAETHLEPSNWSDSRAVIPTILNNSGGLGWRHDLRPWTTLLVQFVSRTGQASNVASIQVIARVKTVKVVPSTTTAAVGDTVILTVETGDMNGSPVSGHTVRLKADSPSGQARLSTNEVQMGVGGQAMVTLTSPTSEIVRITAIYNPGRMDEQTGSVSVTFESQAASPQVPDGAQPPDLPPSSFQPVGPQAGDCPNRFTDLAGYEWAANEIRILAGQGIAQGVGGCRFNPGGQVTKAELAAFLQRLFNLQEPAQSAEFSDVPKTYWGYSVVHAVAPFMPVMAQFGGVSAFFPDQPINRQDVATTVVNILVTTNQLSLQTPAGASSTLIGVPDAGNIAPGLRPQVATVIANRIMVGYPDGGFQPHTLLSRAQIAVILVRLENNFLYSLPSQ